MKVYIAGPYSNIHNAVRAAEKVVEAGHVPYVPHLSHIWHLVSPHSADYWLALDLAWLESCDCLIRLPGLSPGADVEVHRCDELGKPAYGLREFLEVNQ